MKDNCYIDGLSTYKEFGVWVTKGGYNDLLSFPELNDPDKNVWPEEDGIEVDLENPTLRAKEVTITFLASNPNIDSWDFIAFISQPGYHVFGIPALKRTWTLRLLKQPSNEVLRGATSFSLTFVQDSPARAIDYPEPDGGGVYVPASSYEVDGVSLDRYGIFVQSGRDDLLKSSAVRQNLTRTFSTSDGQIYDVGQVVFSEKDVTFKCCLIAESIERFWQCYDAFFNDLIKPELRALYYDKNGETYPCYYKKTSGWNLISLSGRVVVEFSLTLVFTSFRVDGVDFLLTSEDGDEIVCEDGETLIDMNNGKAED